MTRVEMNVPLSKYLCYLNTKGGMERLNQVNFTLNDFYKRGKSLVKKCVSFQNLFLLKIKG